MSNNDVPSEYMHCFNVADEIPGMEPMEVENQQVDLYDTVNIEWYHWEMPGTRVKQAEPDVKKLMDLDSYQSYRQGLIKKEDEDVVEVGSQQKKSNTKKQSAAKTLVRKTRGSYRSYTPEQVQELLDLVIEQGISARKAGFIIGIVERTAQHYVKLYRDDEEKRLPGTRKQRTKWISKLQPHHTDFLCDFYDKNAAAVLWQARDVLLEAFPEIESITLSGLHKHLIDHASLTLKKLDKLVAARTSTNNLNQRREKILEWQADKDMNWQSNCVFIDEAGFNMHIRRNFGRSKRGTPAKTELPSNRGITITIIGAICEKGVIDLSLRKPKAVQKKSTSVKKRKRDNGEGQEVTEVNARIGTRSEHFLKFLTGVMDTLDKHGMKGHYLVMDNAAIHKVSDVQKLIADRGYKATSLPPYSPILNPIELFWSKVKGGVKRDCLTATDNLTARIIESARKVSVEACKGWIQHSYSFFDRCLALDPML